MEDFNTVGITLNVFSGKKKIKTFNGSVLSEETLEMIMEDVGKKLNDEEEA